MSGFIAFFETVFKESMHGNFSFFILVAAIIQIALMVRHKRK